MRKYPKERSVRSWMFFGLKVAVLAEGLFLVGTYWLWNRMNSSQDFRRKMHNKFPSVLECYYLMGEKLGNLPTRHRDYEAWGVTKK